MLHTDIPTRADIEALAAPHDEPCVTIYLPTSTVPTESDSARLALKNLVAEAVEQLRTTQIEKLQTDRIQDLIDDLIDDGGFWRDLCNSLAIFVTPSALQTYRLPDRLAAAVEVSDRFNIKPLLRAATFPQSAFILALAQNSVRMIEVDADLPAHRIHVVGLPTDVASAVGLPSISGRSPDGRLRGSEGQKVRMREYARAVDRAIRPVLTGLGLPLILAASEPLAGIYRSVNSYPNLAQAAIAGNPEETSDDALATAARGILDDIYARELAGLVEVMNSRSANGRAVTDLSDVARAVTYGAVETLFVDVDQTIPGHVDETTGAITLDDDDAPSIHGIVDEIVRRALLTNAKIFAVRQEDVPGGGAVAAGVRFMV